MAKPTMTKCEVCGEKVASTARTCPHCGAKLKKTNPYVIVAGVGLLVIGLCVLISAIAGKKNNDPKKVGEVTQQSEVTAQASDDAPVAADDATTNSSIVVIPITSAPAETEFGIGDRVELNDIVVTLLDVTETAGSEYLGPAEGNTFVLCEFDIENNSSKEINVSSILCFDAYCDDYACSISISALAAKENKNQLDGSVAAGKKLNGVVGYEVPADWKEFEIRFTPDFWAGKEIVFTVDHRQ